MKNKLLTLVLLITLSGLPTISAAAETNFPIPITSVITKNNSKILSPYYQNIRDIIVKNTRNGKALHVYAYITTTSPINISMTTKLEKYSKGKWATIKTWSSQKPSTINLTLSKTCTMTKGYKYRTCVIFKCGNEQVKKYSNIISY